MILHHNNISGNTEEELKRRCISSIVYVLCVALCLYSVIIYVVLKDLNFALATTIYFLVLLYIYLLIRKTCNIKILVHLYLIFDPLFAAFVMLYFWRYSAGMALWILPVPVGAYVFLEKKYVYLYTLYVLLMVVFVTFMGKFVTAETPALNKTDLSDALVGASNMIIVGLLLYYNDKIRAARMAENFEKDRNSSVIEHTLEASTKNEKSGMVKARLSGNDRELEKYMKIFQKVQAMVEEQQSFQDADFTISKLSHLMKINNLYIAKAIKQNGYASFSHYMNVCRIEYVKKLIAENDLSKITLMYIYTSSGFSSQSTFNRVFKQIEGVTPTDYINKLSAE